GGDCFASAVGDIASHSKESAELRRNLFFRRRIATNRRRRRRASGACGAGRWAGGFSSHSKNPRGAGIYRPGTGGGRAGCEAAAVQYGGRKTACLPRDAW